MVAYSFKARFARLDGFADANDMAAFWLDEHGSGVFQGVWVLWREVWPQ